MADDTDDRNVPQGVRDNIDLVAEMENDLAHPRSPGEWLADRIADFVGTVPFVLLHLTGVMAWALCNSSWSGLPVFDRYPFSLLSLLIALEAVLLTSFVLIKQRRMSRQDDRRSHLALQINLLTEQEVTKIIQMLSRISDQMGINEHAADSAAHEMGRDTEIADLARDLEARLPDKH